MLTAITALIAPALFLALRLYVLVPLAAGRLPRGFAALRSPAAPGRPLEHGRGRSPSARCCRWCAWSSLADAVPGPGLFALGATMVLFAAIESAGLKHLWWQVQ